jgi:hypothetical protein
MRIRCWLEGLLGEAPEQVDHGRRVVRLLEKANRLVTRGRRGTARMLG